jgi:hypothetical protein
MPFNYRNKIGWHEFIEFSINSLYEKQERKKPSGD